MLENFRKNAARGAKNIPFVGMGGGSGGGVSRANFFGWNNNLPGAQFDYRKEAGKLWENSVVLALIKFKTRRWPEAEQVVFRPTQTVDGQPAMLTTHPLLDLLREPGGPDGDYDRSVLEAGLVLSYTVDGNAYAYKQRATSGKVVALQYIPHFHIEPYWPKDGSEFLTGYVYRVNGKTYLLPKEDVVHIRDGVDPDNMRKGLSSLGAILREVCTDNEAATFSAALLRNMGVPGVMISPKMAQNVALTPDRMEEIKKNWTSKFRGDSRGEPFVNSIPVEITVPGFSPEQLVLDKVRSIPVSRICVAVGIDPMCIGLPSEQKTYSNYKEALEAAYEGCLVPEQRIFDLQMSRSLMRDMLHVPPTDFLGRDYTKVRVLQEDQDALAERVANLYAQGLIKRSVGLRMIGEKFDATDDVYYTDLTLLKETETSDAATNDEGTNKSLRSERVQVYRTLSRRLGSLLKRWEQIAPPNGDA